MRSTLMLLALISTACGVNYISEVPTGSSSIATNGDNNRVFTVNELEGSVSMVNLDTEEVVTAEVGAQPTRVAVLQDRILVTLRGDRSLVELNANTLEVLRTIETGPEPYGVIGSQDQSRVYVSVAMALGPDGASMGVVEERDGQSLEVLRTFHVPDQPRWLALHPSGNTLVVGRAFGSEVTTVDLTDGSIGTLDLPVQSTEVNISGFPTRFDLSSRVTGDPAFTADGRQLAVPTLYVDNTSGEQGTGDVPSFPYYSVQNSGLGGRFSSSIIIYNADRDGRIEGSANVSLLISDLQIDERNQVPIPLRSYLTSVVPSPEGLAWIGTMESSNAVVVVDATRQRNDEIATNVKAPAVAATFTAAGPRGAVVMDDGRILTHTFLDRKVQDIQYGIVRERTRDEVTTGSLRSAAVSAIDIAPPVTASGLSIEQQRGIKLFYAATDTTMGGTGVSCSTCHFEGRNDGLTWRLLNGDRNTPSLAGPIGQTGVVTWNNQIPTVAEEAMFTAQFRMGSTGLPEIDARAIELFLDATALPDLPDPDAEAVARGKVLFERADVACASCHSGEHFTDGSSHDMYGLAGVTTRPLFGIASSAPYLHDGSAATLRDVLIRSRDGSMGDTSALSDDELDDLEAYLRSL
ncbi:MAG: c-type cytochrome [Myxococcota bacterium]